MQVVAFHCPVQVEGGAAQQLTLTGSCAATSAQPDVLTFTCAVSESPVHSFKDPPVLYN